MMIILKGLDGVYSKKIEARNKKWVNPRGIESHMRLKNLFLG